jgi:hypothetical protein
MADTRTLKLSLLADVQKFLAGMDKAEKGTKGLNRSISKQSKAMAKSFALVGVAAAAFATKIGLDAVQSASDLNEEVSKAEIIFGDVADEIKTFAKTADKALGLTQKEAINAASTFATFGKASGLTGRDLSKFSKSATTLAADLGAFYNTNADEAITAIGAALRGESEPIRKFGVLLNDATIKAKAMEMGLYDGKGALDIQAKSLATYEVILEQTTDAQGNFALTSEDLAGQQKILKAQIENLKAEMGKGLLPVAKDVVTQLNFMAAAFGGKDPEGLSERARELAGVYDGQGGGGYNLGLALKNIGDGFAKLFKAFTDDGDETTDSMTEFASALNSVANGINAVAKAYSGAKTTFRDVKKTAIGQFLFGSYGPGGMFPGLLNPSGVPSRAAGGPVGANQVTRVGEFGPELFVPQGVSGSIRPDNGAGQGVTIIMNGVIDGESARRSIERLLQDSSRRTGAINLVGATL